MIVYVSLNDSVCLAPLLWLCRSICVVVSLQVARACGTTRAPLRRAALFARPHTPGAGGGAHCRRRCGALPRIDLGFPRPLMKFTLVCRIWALSSIRELQSIYCYNILLLYEGGGSRVRDTRAGTPPPRPSPSSTRGCTRCSCGCSSPWSWTTAGSLGRHLGRHSGRRSGRRSGRHLGRHSGRQMRRRPGWPTQGVRVRCCRGARMPRPPLAWAGRSSERPPTTRAPSRARGRAALRRQLSRLR